MKRRRRNLPRTGGHVRRRAIAGALTGVLLVSMLVVVGLGNATTGSSSASAPASQYTSGDWRVIEIAENSVALDINEVGVVAGYTGASPYDPRAVLWVGNEVVNLKTPEGYISSASALNDAGRAAGQVQAPLSPNLAAVWSADGTTVTLLTEDTFSMAHDLNDAGEVVGIGQGYQAFVWDEGNGLQLLPALDGAFTSAQAINNHSQIVGYSGSSAVLWEDGELVVLPTLERGTQASAWDINDAGVAVGGSTDSTGVWHAVMWTWSEPDEGTSASASEYQYGGGWEVVDLGSLGPWTSAQGINEAGQVVGGMRDDADVYRGFYWKDGVFNLLPPLPSDVNSFSSKISDAGLIVGQSSTNLASPHAVVWTRVSDPTDLLAELAEDVAGLGPGTSLAVKIAQAQDALGRGNTHAACGALQAFVNEVEAQTGEKLTTEQAGPLIEKAHEAQSLIGC